MRKKPGTKQSHGEKVVKDIRRATRKQYSAEEKIKIVLDGLKGEDSIAELCRREGIAQSLYYSWSKEFLEAGKTSCVAAILSPRTRQPCNPCAAIESSTENFQSG